METRFAATIANPLGAKQEMHAGRRDASLDDVVTAVRMFSESLLTIRVSKEVQHEVKALAAHMEVLISRKRLAANKSRSPSVAETRLALRNLKRFLEREANKETAREKPSASCTTDTLESSCSNVQAFSPRTVSRTRSFRSVSVNINMANAAAAAASAACGSRGDTDAHRQRPTAGANAAEKLRHDRPRSIHPPASSFGSPPLMSPALEPPQQHQKSPQRKLRKERKPQPPPLPPPPLPPPPPLSGPAQQVQITCSDRQPTLLMLMETVDAAEPAVAPNSHSHVHVLAECAAPEPGATEAQPELQQLLPSAVTDRHISWPHTCALCLCHSPARTERAPLVRPNRQLESDHQVGLAVEMAVEQPVVEAKCDRGDSNDKHCFSNESTAAAVVKDRLRAARKAVIEEQQGNSNCATVSSHVAIVSWAKATTIVDLTAAAAAADPAAIVAARNPQWSSNQMVSTCSCPSDSDVRKASDVTAAGEEDDAAEKKEKDTADSVDLQTSSAQLQPHSSIQAAPVRLEQRVCESSSPEVLVSSTSVLTVGEDPGEWQQPLFRIVDLARLVHTAAPLARSESPTEAPGVAAASRCGGGGSVCGVCGTGGVGDNDSGQSKSTLEVVDQSGDVAALAADPGGPASLGTAAAVAVPAISAAGLATSSVTPALPGCTWSSCDVGHSSGFTKLLLTLDKAAQRRREQIRGQKKRSKQQKQQQQQRTAALNDAAVAAVAGITRGRRTSRSGNNSSRLRSHQKQQQPTPPTETLQTLTPLAAAPSARRQEEALRLAARSLAGLARSLQLCVCRVHDAAYAINCTL